MPSTQAGIPQLGIFICILQAGPGIAVGIVMSALFYAKSSIDLKRNMRACIKTRKTVRTLTTFIVSKNFFYLF